MPPAAPASALIAPSDAIAADCTTSDDLEILSTPNASGTTTSVAAGVVPRQQGSVVLSVRGLRGGAVASVGVGGSAGACEWSASGGDEGSWSSGCDGADFFEDPAEGLSSGGEGAAA